MEIQISAKPLQWAEEQAHPTDGWQEWSEPMMGFRIEFEPKEEPDMRYLATWGEGDSCAHATLDEAKKWCQEQADGWVRDCAQAAVIAA